MELSVANSGPPGEECAFVLELPGVDCSDKDLRDRMVYLIGVSVHVGLTSLSSTIDKHPTPRHMLTGSSGHSLTG